MTISGCLSTIKSLVHHNDQNNEQKMTDECLMFKMNDLLRDKLIDLFFGNEEVFNHKINLSKFSFEYEDGSHNVINLNLPFDVKEYIRKCTNRDNITINVKLF